MMDEVEVLRKQVVALGLSEAAMRYAFETAALTEESRLKELNDVYHALFLIQAELQAAMEAPTKLPAAVQRVLRRLSDYDVDAQRVPFAEVPGGGVFQYRGERFRKLENFRGRPLEPANGVSEADGRGVWFAADAVVTIRNYGV